MSRARVLSVALLAGLCGMVAQVLVVRELVVLFFGNELTIGAALGSWLLWTGIGSSTAGRLLARSRRRAAWVGSAFLALALIAPATIILLGAVARFCALDFGELVSNLTSLEGLVAAARLEPGEVPGIGAMLLYSFALCVPLCLLNGFIFPACCRLSEGPSPQSSPGQRERAEAARERPDATAVAEVYLMEAVGAAVGGLAFALVLVRSLEPISCAALAGAGYAAAGILAGRTVSGPPVLGLLVLLSLFSPKLSSLLRSRALEPYEIVFSQDSIYGRVTVAKAPGQLSLYANGVLAFSYPEFAAAEDLVHIPMCEHPAPRRVLLLGGGVSGTLAEVLKHPVESVVYVELDPLVIRAVREVFPADATRPLLDGRVRVEQGDARLLVRAAAERFDVVIQDLPEPSTAQLNRYYTAEYFREVANALRGCGVYAFRVRASTAYQGWEMSRFLASIREALSRAFPEVLCLPGESCLFLAAVAKGTLTSDPAVVARRLDERKVEMLYMTGADLGSLRFHRGYLDDLERRMAKAGAGRLNRDLAPRCYLYDVVLWWKMYGHGRGQQSGLAKVLLNLDGWEVLPLAVLLAAAVSGVGLIARGRRGLIAGCVATTGLAEMGIEFIALLGFQVAYGYAYQLIALVMGAFMIGLAVGGAIASRRLAAAGPRLGDLRVVQSAVAVYPLVLFGVIALLARSGGVRGLPAAAIFGSLVFATGVIGGVQFPLANALYGGTEAAGSSYAWDLIGSCVGAVLISIVVAPVAGIAGACIFLVVVNALCTGLLFLARPAAPGGG